MNADEARRKEQSEEDVKKHNEDMERRYDRAFSQIGTEKGDVSGLDEETKRNKNKGE